MKKNLNKLATLALTGAMVAGMSFGAMADTSADGSQLKNAAYAQKEVLGKRVLTDGKTYAPNATFAFNVGAVKTLPENFKVKAVSSDEGQNLDNYFKTTTDEQAAKVKVGTNEDGENDVTFKADWDGNNELNGKDLNGSGEVELESGKKTTYFEKKASVRIAEETFTEPGIYLFTIEEDGKTPYEGVAYNTGSYYMLVQVENNEAGNALVVKSVNFADPKTGVKFSEIYNNYGAAIPSNPDIPNIPSGDEVYDLTVSKSIKGAGANSSAKFKFDFSILANRVDGDYAVYSVTKNSDGSETETFVKNLSDATGTGALEVGQGTTYRIHGLSKSDAVTLKENMGDNVGYTATYKLSGTQEVNTDVTNGDALNAEGVEVHATADATLAVTNTKTEITVTGVAMNIAPYAAMVLGAGAFAGIFLGGKRRKAEDED